MRSIWVSRPAECKINTGTHIMLGSQNGAGPSTIPPAAPGTVDDVEMPPSLDVVLDVEMRTLTTLPPLTDDDSEITATSTVFAPARPPAVATPPTAATAPIAPITMPTAAITVPTATISTATATPSAPKASAIKSAPAAAPAAIVATARTKPKPKPVKHPSTPDPKEKYGIALLNDPLRIEMLAMPRAQRQAYGYKLSRMGVEELTRENSQARNRWMLEELGLKNHGLFEGMKRKRVDGDKGGKRKKSRKDAEWDSEAEDEESSTQESGKEENDVEVVPRGGGRTRSRGKQSGKKSDANTAEISSSAEASTGPVKPVAWAVKAQKRLLKGGQLGKGWEKLVGLWWKLEESTRFATKVTLYLVLIDPWR